MLRPIYLQPGDKVALISPSGVATKEQLDGSWNLYPDNTFFPDTGDWQARMKNDYMIYKQPLTPRTSGPSGVWREITGCYVSCKRRIIPYFKETPNG